MSKKIADKFTKLPISRQQKYQMRKKAKGLCEQCHRQALQWGLCKIHVVKKRQERRKLHGCVKAYVCLTAQLEKKLGVIESSPTGNP